MRTTDAALAGSARVYTDEHYLKVPAVLARTGIQLYTAGEIGHPTLAADEVVRVYRPPEEVFSEASMASFGMKPVTNDHPDELVSAENVKALQVGFSSENIERDGDLLKATLVITDPKAIYDIERGKRELSNGYEADYDLTPGVTLEGEAYDVVQRNMRGNHIAIVESGRCGPECAVADSVKPKEARMPKAKKIKVGSKSYTEDELKKILDAHEEKAADGEEEEAKDGEEEEAKDGEEEEAKDGEEEETGFDSGAEVIRLRKVAARAEAAADVAAAKVLDEGAIGRLVAVRSQICSDARRLFPKIVILDKTPNVEIMREVVTELCADCDVADKEEAYVEAYFDALRKGGGESGRFFDRNMTGDKVKATDTSSPMETARDKYMADQRDAHMRSEDRTEKGAA